MRRLALVTALAAALISGCGGGGSAGPLEEGLSYLPKDTPFAVAIDTNTSGSQYRALGDLVQKFPFGDQLRQSLRRQLEEGGEVTFDRDLKPLLGNPFVVGGINPRAVTDGRPDDEFVGALKVKDKDKLEATVERQGAREDGEASGAKLYKARDGDSFAIKDDVLVVAGSKRLLQDALARSEGDDHLDREAFDKGLDGLPGGGLLRLYANVGELIRSEPGSRDALKIKWVRALTTLGMTAEARDDQLAVQFKLATGGGLSDADLPIAPGDAAPGVVERAGEIGVGLRDPSRIARFAESALQATSPSDYGQYTAGKRQIEQRYGVDVDRDLLDQLKGDTATTVSVDGKFAARAELEDPAAMRRTLRRLAPALPQLMSGARLERPRRGEDLYAISDGGQSVVFGVVRDVFVIGNDAARAGQVATASPTTVGAAKGAVVMKADAEQVANSALRRLGPQLGLGGAFGSRLFTGPLGELNGSVSSSTSGLRGRVTLGVE